MPTATNTPNYITGQAVAVIVGGKAAYCADGTATRKVKLITVTNSRSGGYQQVKAGTKSASVSINCFYNGDDPPTGIVEGAEVVLVVDTLGNATEIGSNNPSSTPKGRFLEIPMLIEQIVDKWSSDGDYKWTFDGQSSGAYVVSENSADQTTTTGATTTVTEPTAP